MYMYCSSSQVLSMLLACYKTGFFLSQTPPTVKRKGETYSSLPSSVGSKADPKATPSLQPSLAPRKKGFASVGKGFFKLRTGKWSSSAPNRGDGAHFLSLHVL